MKAKSFSLVIALFILSIVISGCLLKKEPGYICVGTSCVEVKDDATYDTRWECESDCIPCNYQQSYEVNNCNEGWYAVSETKCCPEDYPYHCSVTASCYATCEAAQLACNGVSTTRANLSGGTGGNTSGYRCISGDCQYVSSGASYSSLSACESACGSEVCVAQLPYMPIGCQYTCSGGTVTVGCNKCCPSSKPYYCNVTGNCYATCEEARAAGCTKPVKGY